MKTYQATIFSRDSGEAEDAASHRWDQAVLEAPGGGHALQSYAWGEFKRKQGWVPFRMLLRREGEVLGAGQFLAHGTLPVPGRILYCPKGPWIPWEDEAAVQAFFEGARELARNIGAHTVRIEPEVAEERGEVRDLLGGLGFTDARYDLNFSSTIVMDLSPSGEELLDRMSAKGKKGKNTRHSINLATRKDVEVYRPEDFNWAFETLHRWIEDLAEHKEGFSNRRPRWYFREMMRRMYEAGQGHFFFAAHEGEPISGSFVFTFGEKLWFMHGASNGGLSREKRKLQGNYLLQWEIMRWARERGITYADFVGAPRPEDLTEDDPYYGSYEFKRGFGGEIVGFIGCLDLPVKPRRAALWYRLEPLYYRAYYKLKGNVFY